MAEVPSGRANLHLHTTFSDGELPPADVVAAHVTAGFVAIALTDHDTLAGIDAMGGLEGHGVAIVSGVELSIEDEPRRGRDYGGPPQPSGLDGMMINTGLLVLFCALGFCCCSPGGLVWKRRLDFGTSALVGSGSYSYMRVQLPLDAECCISRILPTSSYL